MGFIRNIIKNYQEKAEERNRTCNQLIVQCTCALQEVRKIFASSSLFIDPNEANKWNKRNAELLWKMDIYHIKELKKATEYANLLSKQQELFSIKQFLPQQIQEHNNRVANARIAAAYRLIGDVEGRALDKQQMACIVKEVHNHLVIAGAGTGKTTTIVGKIKYLLKSGKYSASDILVLSFTNASATEMRERIIAETGQPIDALTFHKLGLNIIARVSGVIPRITKISLQKFIKEQICLNIRANSYLNLLNSYLLYYRVKAKSEFDFKTKQEYDEYLKLNPPTTINNEVVKSYGEMDIANFLMQNGIRYIYEQPYKTDTRTSEYGQYYPDFFLPDYNVYIEYFGIDKTGEVPPYFSGKGGLSAGQAYRASMDWKRQLHAANHTVMIECYAYEKFDGSLLENLTRKLVTAAVELRPKSTEDLWKQISQRNSSLLDGLSDLFVTLINLTKSNGYTIQMLRKKSCNSINEKANHILLSLLEPIYDAYCSYLFEHDEIDFNDMINLASRYVREGKYINPYRYVIVDEYQDISKSRFSFLDSLRKSRDFELFCVGDDWQSIYRFAGSDIDYITNFSKHWGATEISRIETTYRFSQKLIEITGNFIMKNPTQIRKAMKGKTGEKYFPLGVISGYTERNAIEFTAKKLADIPRGSSVYFIGRYLFDVNLLSDSPFFSCRYNNATGLTEVFYQARPDLKMVFITAHRSKGLQADYVFVVNNKNCRMGFPSKVQEVPILNLLLDNCEQYPYAEERRLFYVALTRAKKKVFIITQNGHESIFARELMTQYANELKQERFTCPLCGGRLLKRSGEYGEFFGCSNYHKTGCTYTRKIG